MGEREKRKEIGRDREKTKGAKGRDSERGRERNIDDR